MYIYIYYKTWIQDFSHESGPRGAPRARTKSERSVRPPESFLNSSQAFLIQCSVPKYAKKCMLWLGPCWDNFIHPPHLCPRYNSSLKGYPRTNLKRKSGPAGKRRPGPARKTGQKQEIRPNIFDIFNIFYILF